MASLMDNFLNSGAIAYPSNAAAKKMLKEIPALAGVEVASLKTGLRSKLAAGKTAPAKTRGGRDS
ncbi:MAG: hypothetical protein ACI4OR_01335 [Alphaproteobacteria bacterium]